MERGFSSIVPSFYRRMKLPTRSPKLRDGAPRARRWAALALAILVPLGPAHAQLRLPGVPTTPSVPSAPLPNLPGPTPGPLTAPVRSADSVVAALPLQELRQRTIGELMRRYPERIEADPAGEPIVRGELLLVSPSAALLATARAQGYSVLREQSLDGLGERIVVLRAPPGTGTADALEQLRAIDPNLEVDFNHLYTRSGDDSHPGHASTPGPAPPVLRSAPGSRVRVGLVDGGVDAHHPALRDADIHHWGCGGHTVRSPHGTAVGSLLVGKIGPFRGAAAAASLYAADVYCAQPTGGAAETIVQALAWMAREQVPVVNLSLVGPANRLLERAVRALAARGQIVVAAVGNDGPQAPPLYPASYPEVVGVTAVNASRNVLPEAARGPQVAFAAPGADMAVATERGFEPARGTSYAAPIVAGLLASLLRVPDPAGAVRAIAELAQSATDLGEPGRDPAYGWGLVGETVRVHPERMQAYLRSAR